MILAAAKYSQAIGVMDVYKILFQATKRSVNHRLRALFAVAAGRRHT